MTSFTPRRLLRDVFHRAGLDVRRYRPHPPHALPTLLDLYRVDTIFDVGANGGVSGEYFRNAGFTHTIVSFEPVSRFYEQLRQKASRDPRWLCERIAIGDVETEMDISVSGDSGGASSFLEMTANVTANAPELGYTGRERVQVRTIDSIIDRYYPIGDRLFLKLDVQGFEKRALEGATASLPRIVGMKVEMSLVQNYVGELLAGDMLPFFYALGFRLMGIEPAWGNPVTQELYQVDAILFRPERLPSPR
jgi:FkbM family methyltransferase